MEERVRIIEVETLARNWGRLERYTLEFRRNDGVWDRQVREVYDHGSAAAILLYCVASRTVVLTRQFRLPVHLEGGNTLSIEVCAGLLDGDAPEACARREAVEETGFLPETLSHAFDTFMSPGSLTEKVSCFLGSYRPGHKVAAGGGLSAEGEDIEVLELGFDAALAMIRGGRIVDAKTVMLLQHAALTGLFAGPAA